MSKPSERAVRCETRPAIVSDMIRDSALIKVRSAKASDSDALNRVFRDAWRQAYTGIIPPMHLERMIRRRDVRWWRNAIKTESNLLVLEVAGVIAGYASCGAARCGKVACGEIYEIYVAPLYQGAGLGVFREGCVAPSATENAAQGAWIPRCGDGHSAAGDGDCGGVFR